MDARPSPKTTSFQSLSTPSISRFAASCLATVCSSRFPTRARSLLRYPPDVSPASFRASPLPTPRPSASQRHFSSSSFARYRGALAMPPAINGDERIILSNVGFIAGRSGFPSANLFMRPIFPRSSSTILRPAYGATSAISDIKPPFSPENVSLPVSAVS